MSKSILPTSGVRWGISFEVTDEVGLGVMLGYATMMGAENIAWAPIGAPGKKKARGPHARPVNRAKPGATFDVLAKLPARFTRGEALKALEVAGFNTKAGYQTIVRWTKTKLITRSGPGRYQRNDVKLKFAVERLIKQGRAVAA